MMITEDLVKNAIVEPAETNVSGTEPDARFVLHKAAEALQPQPPIDWVVQGLLSAGSVNMWFGDAGAKKTYSVMDLAVCVARGEPWLQFSTKPGPVLIVDEESGYRRMNRRLGNVLRGHCCHPDTPLVYLSLACLDFGNPDDINELHALMLQTGARLVIIDALADVMPGRDENSVKDVQPILLGLRRLADITQAAIVVIHHANKLGAQRGSTAIKGAVDLMLLIESKPNTLTVEFTTEKARDIEPVSFAALAHFEEQSFRLSPTKVSVMDLGKAQEYVLHYLQDHGPSEKADIKAGADVCSPEAAVKALYSLADGGLRCVQRVNTGGRGQKAIYDLTEKGREYVRNL